MRRFYCEKENIYGNRIVFGKEEANHIRRVLRLQCGEKIIVCTGDGNDMICNLLDTEECCAEIEEIKQNENEIKCKLVLFQGIIKNEKMDYALQKAAEIGVTEIVPVICERTVVKVENTKDAEKKRERWQKIVREACKQCGRSKVPEVLAPMPFESAIKIIGELETKITAYEEEKTQNITTAVKKSDSIGYFIGPEGGISEKEFKKLTEIGAVSVSLGKRILRAETASVVCGAVILALVGEMNV